MSNLLALLTEWTVELGHQPVTMPMTPRVTDKPKTFQCREWDHQGDLVTF